MPWYALYTKPRHEKTVFTQLSEKKVESFLPLIKKVRQWKDRKKKVEMPLFSSYVFANFLYKQRFDILGTNGIVKIVNFGGEPAVIPDWQIAVLQKMLEFPESLQLENYLKPGELVEVVQGPMRGLKGTIVSLKNADRLVLSIDGIMQSVSVEISQSDLKKVKQ